ncbi:MAG: DUF6570 domain-containing protein, partial [Planctomycetota bacterium]
MYKDLVSEDGSFLLCRMCLNSVLNNKSPAFSLSTGLCIFPCHPDLPEPTPLERCVISFNRRYTTYVTLKANAHLTAMRGHVCCFPHKAPAAIAEHFSYPPDGQPVIKDLFNVRLVGNAESLTKFKKDALQMTDDYQKLLADGNNNNNNGVVPNVPSLQNLRTPNFRPTRDEFWPLLLRSRVVLSWIIFLKQMKHPRYAQLELSPAILARFSTRLDGEQRAIIHESDLLNEAEQDLVSKENDDIAKVRNMESGTVDASIVIERPDVAPTSHAMLTVISQRIERAKANSRANLQPAPAAAARSIGSAAESDQRGGPSPFSFFGGAGAATGQLGADGDFLYAESIQRGSALDMETLGDGYGGRSPSRLVGDDVTARRIAFSPFLSPQADYDAMCDAGCATRDEPAEDFEFAEENYDEDESF